VENLLTDKARKVWLYWKQNLSGKDKWLERTPQLDPEVQEFIRDYGRDPFRDPRSHGTVHLSACDGRGDLAGCTSTCGLFFKMPGRVGDSALIGGGCFVDNAVGAAGSTGRGEANILVSGGHLLVERMRAGRSPKDACLDVLKRIAETTKEKRLLDDRGRARFPISFYAVSKSGVYGMASMWSHRPSASWCSSRWPTPVARGWRTRRTSTRECRRSRTSDGASGFACRTWEPVRDASPGWEPGACHPAGSDSADDAAAPGLGSGRGVPVDTGSGDAQPRDSTTQGDPTMAKRVAILLGQGFEDSEFKVPYDRLKAEGFEVDVIGREGGEELVGAKGKVRTRATRSIADVRPDAYHALLIPGGYSPTSSVPTSASSAS
jgi:hypothetical protein